MRAIRILPAGLRRRVQLLLTCSALVLMATSLAQAQAPPAQAPPADQAAAPQAAPPGRSFTSDAGMRIASAASGTCISAASVKVPSGPRKVYVTGEAGIALISPLTG